MRLRLYESSMRMRYADEILARPPLSLLRLRPASCAHDVEVYASNIGCYEDEGDCNALRPQS